MPKLSLQAVLTVTAGVIALAGAGLVATTSPARADTKNADSMPMRPYCDRACLIGITDQYLAALAAHDPSQVPLSRDIGFVENLKRMKPGEGLWQHVTAGPTTFKIYIPDEDMQEAAWVGVLQVDGKPAEMALRLKVKDGKITEAEHLYAAANERAMANLKTPRPGLVSEIPASERLPHDELMRIGIQYYDALDDNDGSKMPFAADCERHENGIITAGPHAGPPTNSNDKLPPVAHDCAGQIDSNSFAYIKFINDRRIVAADPVTGLAIGFSQFRHPFDNLPYMVQHVNGMYTERNAKNMPYKPFDMPAAHIFKIGADHKVHEIEAVGAVEPFMSPTGWEPRD